MARKRKIIVHIATSADGYIARRDGEIDWLTERPAPKGFYGMPRFMRSIDATILGRKTFDLAVKLGATFSVDNMHYVFSRRPAPAVAPAGVEFVTESIGKFVARLRRKRGKDIWMMGGGEIIAAFLDAGAIDEFVISIIPALLGQGIPVIAATHRDVALRLRSTRSFPDGVVQVRYEVVRKRAGITGRRARSGRRRRA
jgi:dihydrofolate reductase